MPGQAPPAPERRMLRFLPRVILDSLMSAAVMVLERRIRKALRSGGSGGSGAGPGRSIPELSGPHNGGSSSALLTVASLPTLKSHQTRRPTIFGE